MILALLQLAFGSQCFLQPQQLVVDAHTLHTRGAMSVWVQGGYAVPVEDLANRFRLRGPEGVLAPLQADHLLGEVRLTPRKRLDPGAYTLEMLADFDAEGERIELGTRVEVARSAWFPYERYEVRELDPAALDTLEAPTDATWSRIHNATRSSAGEATALEVSASAPAGTRVEVEIDGVGPVGRGRAHASGRVWMRLARDMCTHDPLDLPRAGDLRVRLVSVGVDGARAPGPWVTLGPSLPVDHGPLPPAPPPSGNPASLEGIATWEPLPRHPAPGDTVVAATSCGRLVPRGEPVLLETGPDEQVLVDADQRFRRVGIPAGQLRLDGEDVDFVLPSRERAQLHLAGAGDTLTIGVHDVRKEWLYVLRIAGTQVLERAEIFGVRRITAFDLDGPELRVAWTEGHGVRWVQGFDAGLAPLGPPTEITEPVEFGSISGLESGASFGIAVNGHAVDVLDLHHLHEGATVYEGLAYLPAYAKDSRRLAVVRPDGSLAWSLDLVDPFTLRRLGVDDRGVHLLVHDYRDRAQPDIARSFTHAGVEIPALPLPPKAPVSQIRAPEAVERRVHAGRTVVAHSGRVRLLGVEEDGRPSPMTRIAGNAVIAVRPDGAEVAWSGLPDPTRRPSVGETAQTWRQSLVCSGESLGVPEAWTPGG